MIYLHIISFDVPYPANYGGVIDVFHKIRCLHRAGVKIILHCFEYGRGKKVELEQYCEKVYYYKRRKGLHLLFAPLPYIVITRKHSELLLNLMRDEHPILFEGLHTCLLLNNPKLKTRLKIFRESNIEHDYYGQLAKSETSILKKIFFYVEAFKLERFEKQVLHSNLMLIVSEDDTKHFKNKYPANTIYYLPSFHAQDDLQCKTGKGAYAFYNGNLMVSENLHAAHFLIDEIFSKINYPLVIAGLKAPESLIEKSLKFKHIKIISSPDEKTMNSLMENAHIHCLFTFQTTGLKLKLLNVLYRGRHVICNQAMLHGTQLHKFCTIAEKPEEIIKQINVLKEESFDEKALEKRKCILNSDFSNSIKTQKLIQFIENR
jgi:hypothetical protein